MVLRFLFSVLLILKIDARETILCPQKVFFHLISLSMFRKGHFKNKWISFFVLKLFDEVQRVADFFLTYIVL